MVKKATKNKKVSNKLKETSKVEKVDAELINDDEPNWYHYLIVLLIFASVFGVLYVGYTFFYEEEVQIPSNSSVLTKYPYIKGNITYNLYFHNSISEIENMSFPVQVDKLDLLNTKNFIMAFDEYNGTDNGEVTRGSTKMVSFLRTVYRFKFAQGSFVRVNETNCLNSTLSSKVIIYDPYSSREGVFYNETNGCIKFETSEPTHLVDLVDKLIYEVVTSE